MFKKFDRFRYIYSDQIKFVACGLFGAFLYRDISVSIKHPWGLVPFTLITASFFLVSWNWLLRRKDDT